MEKFLIGVVIFLTSVIQGIFGFAFVLVGMPLLSFFLNIKVAAPLLALFTVLITGIMTFRLKKKFDFKRVMPLFIGAVLGIPVGIFFLLKFSDNLIKSTLGVVLIVYSAYSLLIKRILCKLPRWTGYIFGFFAGALGGAFNTTGPPVVFYMSTQEWSKIEIVGSLNFFSL
ncbi:MAG: sulfite exporter TauE/SafE family protein [Nitrospirae bacterium]|jgi:uncharacterized membrane protein YfcA|nr:sulfite exporter TauE/SafE family protein [Nitrospirota bacterium]